EGVAADARNRRPATAVLRHEVGDHVPAEAVLHVEDIVRDAERLTDTARVVDRVEGAAGAVGHAVAITEKLERGADHLMALRHELGGGDRAVHPAAHGHEDPGAASCRRRWTLDHGQRLSARPRARTLATARGNTSATRRTSSAVVSWPRLSRMAER